MASLILRPFGETVLVVEVPIPGSGVVGPAPQWGDQDDATYAIIQADFATPREAGLADLPAAGIDTTTVTAFVTHVRVDGIGLTAGTTVRAGLISGGVLIGLTLEAELSAGVAEYSSSFDGDTAQALAEFAIGGDAQFRADIGGEADDGTRIHVLEGWFEITYSGGRRPCRMFPRHDGQNMSSAPRIVGGYQ